MRRSSIDLITLYDIGNGFDVWLKKNKHFGFDVFLESCHEQIEIEEKGVHPYVIESIADFCRGFLRCYDSVMKED